MPTDCDKLLAIADRCEAATEDQQRELLLEAGELLWGWHSSGDTEPNLWVRRWNRFHRKLEAEAYESAAMSLVPERCTWRVDHAASRHGQRAIGAAFVISPPASGQKYNGDATTPALALTAACLRALAAAS